MGTSTARKTVSVAVDPWISVREAARQLKISPPAVLTRVIQGHLKAQTVAGRTFIDRASVEAALGKDA